MLLLVEEVEASEGAELVALTVSVEMIVDGEIWVSSRTLFWNFRCFENIYSKGFLFIYYEIFNEETF